MLRSFKFVVQAVVLEFDQDGNPIGERYTEPVSLYGTEKLAEWAANFDLELQAAELEPATDNRGVIRGGQL